MGILRLAIGLILAGLLLSFNNCSKTDSSIFRADNSSSQSAISIALKTPNPYRIPSDVQLFVAWGSCNSGPFSLTEVSWFIENSQGVVILDSFSAGGGQFISVCQNDEFNISVRVPCPGLVNTGSGCFGLTQSYRLYMQIYGLNASGNAELHQISKPVTLSPL